MVRRYRLRLYLLLFIILSVICYEGYELSKAFKRWYYYRQQVELCKQSIDDLRSQNELLEKVAHELQHNEFAQEKVAREMGYVKPGETVYRFVNKEPEADQ